MIKFENSSPALGVRFGYSLNILDLILSGYARFVTGISSETNVFSSEFGGDVVYQFSSDYSTSKINPALYGFVLLLNLEITNSSSNEIIQGVNASGLVFGIGGSVVWD